MPREDSITTILNPRRDFYVNRDDRENTCISVLQLQYTYLGLVLTKPNHNTLTPV